ncbi:hypothetical protein VNO77_39168 [Canavalia gladiata]|uniref:Uncharacterized protein n=1 Tax=Canavalia gladiata TaxID=3824 RepID=A0AAN9KCN8_CANGL
MLVLLSGEGILILVPHSSTKSFIRVISESYGAWIQARKVRFQSHPSKRSDSRSASYDLSLERQGSAVEPYLQLPFSSSELSVQLRVGGFRLCLVRILDRARTDIINAFNQGCGEALDLTDSATTYQPCILYGKSNSCCGLCKLQESGTKGYGSRSGVRAKGGKACKSDQKPDKKSLGPVIQVNLGPRQQETDLRAAWVDELKLLLLDEKDHKSQDESKYQESIEASISSIVQVLATTSHGLMIALFKFKISSCRQVLVRLKFQKSTSFVELV